jgi:hypothetical protein
MSKPSVREATFDDAKYFLRAAEKFCKQAGLKYNRNDTADSLFGWFNSASVKMFVLGDPAMAHCIVAVVPSSYDRSERTARVISTWGHGGIKCFHHALRWAKENQIELFSADSFLDERFERVYERAGMSKADVLYVTRLNHGH